MIFTITPKLVLNKKIFVYLVAFPGLPGQVWEKHLGDSIKIILRKSTLLILQPMPNNKKYLRYTWFVLFMVMLVIIAGGVVRMTQSGMGCPDWPKCFGRWIPPINASQLPADFEKYLKAQDIDHMFNAYHTWIEYINRLLGALLGVFIFIHFIWSFKKFRKTNRPVVYLSLFLLITVAFQGWLGKKVVDANLAVVKITIHMLVALLIAAIPLAIINKLSTTDRLKNPFLKNFSVVILALLLIQIILGTQVREQIDQISKSLGYTQREIWIGRLDKIFFVHRSFSWLVIAGCLILFWKGYQYKELQKNSLLILSSAIAVVMIGIIMAYMHMPAAAQPLHLLGASILILSVFSFRLKIK
jgi:heme a synthase